MAMRNGGDSNDWFFLAMAHWHLGRKDEARKWYQKGTEWMDKHQPKNAELRRFRAEAAKLLGIHFDTLARYVAAGKVPSPEMIAVGQGKRVVHLWTEPEIERVRKLLPKIANGRKTRYKKKQSALSNQQSVKAKQKKKK